MEKLDSKYVNLVEDIKTRVQASSALEALLEEDSEANFQALRDEFEPEIHELYMEVGQSKPLQLIDLEQCLMHPDFEGVYLPKI